MHSLPLTRKGWEGASLETSQKTCRIKHSPALSGERRQDRFSSVHKSDKYLFLSSFPYQTDMFVVKEILN
jgi:hypothetical protein